MAQHSTDMSGDALLQFKLRQAALAAQHGIKQVGLLLIGLNGTEQALKQTAEVVETSQKMLTRIRSTLRDSDTVVKLTDREIAVLLPSVNGPEDATLVAKKILNKLNEPRPLNGLELNDHSRIGVALFPEHSPDTNNLVARAEAALSAARRKQISLVVYSHEESQANRPPLRMSQLRQAIVMDQLFLLYQPKINLKDGSVSGVEALARWQHPELGLIPPDEFIPVAERTGLIVPLTLWVLQQSLLQCRAWNEMGIPIGVAVNLSMWNLDADELPEQIDGLLKNVGVAPDRLELEITESAIMGDPQRAMRSLALIRDLGVRLAIDDFGTGYSSLAHLRKLPVAGLKIDKSFVQDMEHERDNAVIVRSIIDLGHNLGLKVIAEGVETSEARDMLRSLDCDEAQGYYYSRPISAPAVYHFHNHRTQQIMQPMLPDDLTAELSIPTAGHRNGVERHTKL